MEVNDNRSDVDKSCDMENDGSCYGQVQEIYLDDDDEDVHVCRKCNMIFYDIQKYLEHKVKHDNFRVKYCKSDVDKRMMMPKLIQKPLKKEPVEQMDNCQSEEKENDSGKIKKKRRRQRIYEVHSQDQIIDVKPTYVCSKCDRKFNREASLKRHMEYDHAENDDDDNDDTVGDDLLADDDGDQDYKPSIDIIKEVQEEDEKAEQEMQESETLDEDDIDVPEIDNLNQVIMAAELVEKVDAASQNSGDGEYTGKCDRQVVMVSCEKAGSITPGARLVKVTPRPVPPVPKQQKLPDEDRLVRRYSCHICDNKFKELNVLKTHMLTHTNKRDYTCTIQGCTYAFKTKGSLKRHLRRHTGERPYPCELCGRSFAESGALTRHLKSRIPCTNKTDDDLPRYGKKWTYVPSIPATHGTETSPHITDINTNNMIQEMPIGSVQFQSDDNSIEEPITDLQTATQELEPITALPTVTQTLEDTLHNSPFDIEHSEGIEVVISHSMTADESIQEFVQTETVIQEKQASICKVCHEDFLSVEALKIHLHTHLADNTCRCLLCHFVSDNKDDFENHMFMHHHVQLRSSDPYTNMEESRNREMPEKDKMATHRDAQTAVHQLMDLPQDSEETETSSVIAGPLYRCPVCNKQFRGSSYLKLHMRNHTGLRPHKCSECDRSFITKDTLNKHMSSHIDTRNFKCGECNKLFKRLSHVREHIKIHSGTRPFPCSICEKTFKTNNAMKVHIRTHTDIMPYECNFCHRRFREKGSVIRHTRMHTGEKPYECRFCRRKFAEHGTLNRHLRAKVSCRKQMVLMNDYVDDKDGDYTVLAEFSSVVADTQQYMVQEHVSSPVQGQEVTSQEEQEQEEEIMDEQNQPQEAEFVLVHTDEEDRALESVDVQSVKIVRDGKTSVIEGVQVADDYIVVNVPEEHCMRIVDNKTGETVVIVPIDHTDDSVKQVLTVTMCQDEEITTDDGGVATMPFLGNGQIKEATDGEQVEMLHNNVSRNVPLHLIVDSIYSKSSNDRAEEIDTGQSCDNERSVENDAGLASDNGQSDDQHTGLAGEELDVMEEQ